MRSFSGGCLILSEPSDPRRITGILGEKAAERHLAAGGMRILKRGFRFRGGEVDLIAKDDRELVFVEVKTRTPGDFGHPAEAVTFAKRRKILQAASMYLKSRGAWQHPCRFDVISVWVEGHKVTRLEHVRDAFRADD